MNRAVVAAVILALSAAPARGQQLVAFDFTQSTVPALISLHISCDLIAEFVTPPIDARTVQLLDSPVSREGARLRKELWQTRGWGVFRVPLIVKEGSAQRSEDHRSLSPGVWSSDWKVRLMSARCNVVDARACGLIGITGRVGVGHVQ